MKRTFALMLVAAAGALLVAGCGDDGSADEADQEAITALVAELNRVTEEKDAKGFCDVMQPSRIESTFRSHARCVKETAAILEQAGDQPTLEVDSVEVEGDTALVKFTGRNGEAPLVREDGEWYIPLEAEARISPGDGTTGDENAGDEPTGDEG